MLPFLRKRATSCVGIDISPSAVKLLELTRIGSQFRVDGFAIEPVILEENEISELHFDKTIKDVDAIITALNAVVDKARPKSRIAALAIPDSLVISKVVQMEAGLNEEEIESQVMVEADRHIPYPVEEVSLDYEVLGLSTRSPELIDVLLVASRKENVDTRLDIMESCGFSVRTMDVESYTMERACQMVAQRLDGQGVDKVIAVVDIGATAMTLTMLDNLNAVFSREESIGGIHLTQQIQQQYGMSFQEAGKAKKTGELPGDYEEVIRKPFMESLVVQLERAMQFYLSTEQKTIDNIILAGGTSMLDGLVELIAERFRVPTNLANPFVDMELAAGVDAKALERDAPALMICSGLAMRSLTT